MINRRIYLLLIIPFLFVLPIICMLAPMSDAFGVMETEVIQIEKISSYYSQGNQPSPRGNRHFSESLNSVYHSSQENPEAYFPNFLYYSKIVANALVEHLFDNVSGGFYRSADDHWFVADYKKNTYGQAQAILAFLKISEAVFNDTERDFAIQIANKTANFMISELWDSEFGGFYIDEDKSVYRRPAIQGKAIQALLELYRITGNQTLLNIAEDALTFMNNFGWDPTKGGYYYIITHVGSIAGINPNQFDVYAPSAKRVDHNVIMGKALVDFYRTTSNTSYLSKARETYHFINTTCRNTTTGLFYTGVSDTNEIVEPTYSDVFVNCQVLEFLSYLYNATSDFIYFDDFESLLASVLLSPGYWDNQNAGFYATFSYTASEDRDLKKYTERQFYALRAIDEAYRNTQDPFFYNLILDVMEFLNDQLYDNSLEGYFQLVNRDNQIAQSDWADKHTVTQALAVYELANLWLYSKPAVNNAIWSPSQPRPVDKVMITAAAFDSDGIAKVLLNYSINSGPYQTIEMHANTLVGSLYNISLGSHPNGTSISFEIIVNDTLGNTMIRGSYYFLYLRDIYSPHVLEALIDPDHVVDVHEKVVMYVSAHDVPSQGSISTVNIYYHTEEEDEHVRRLIPQGGGIWMYEFPDGFDSPEKITYYYEAIDGEGNIGY
ncbi:MAG: glycoside hydrolase family 76 protein, partial [Candidatus Hodarchaeota archaeon]